MKILLLLLPIATFSANAQKCGVYLNAADFVNEKLAFENDCSAKKHRIKLNDFLEKPYIEVVYKDESRLLMKNEIFGYKNCDGEVSRFVDNQHYKILNPTEHIFLYERKVLASKNQPVAEFYYFSPSAGGIVAPLTLDNIKKAFPENHKFHDLLDAEFDSNRELTQYDSHHKSFKINRLYANSLQ